MPTEEHGSAGNGWIHYRAHLQAKIGLWGMGEGHERCVLTLLCLSCAILTAVIISQHIVNVSARDNATGKSQSMAKDIEKTVADAEQFAAVHACGEANSLLSKFSTNKRYWISFYYLQDIETTHEKMRKATITRAQRPNNQIQHVNASARAQECGERMDTLRTAGVSCLQAGIGS